MGAGLSQGLIVLGQGRVQRPGSVWSFLWSETIPRGPLGGMPHDTMTLRPQKPLGRR